MDTIDSFWKLHPDQLALLKAGATKPARLGAAHLAHRLYQAEADASRVAEQLAESAEQRAKASRKGSKARRRIASEKFDEIAADIAVDARKYRRLHPDSPLSAVMRHLRRIHLLEDISDSRLRLYLHKLGLR